MDPHRTVPALATAFLRRSFSKALFVLVATLSVLHVLSLPRSGMIDQGNYLQYFIDAPDLHWFRSIANAQSWLEYGSLLLMEEALWVIWTTILGLLFEPEIATYITVGILNALVAISLRDYRNPMLALLLWILLPVGFAIIGLYQIRQGLAFGVWLLVAIRWRKPVIGTIIASAVHSTFLVLVPIAFIATRKSMPVWLRLSVMVGLCMLTAYFGQIVFEQLGGRRIDVYAFMDETFNSRFLISLFIYMIFPLLTAVGAHHQEDSAKTGLEFHMEVYSVFYLGLIAYLIACYFLFPLGLYRVNYMVMLGLIPIVGNVDFSALRRQRLPSMSVVFGLGPTLALLIYQIIKAAMENRYACAIVENCVAIIGQ